MSSDGRHYSYTVSEVIKVLDTCINRLSGDTDERARYYAHQCREFFKVSKAVYNSNTPWKEVREFRLEEIQAESDRLHQALAELEQEKTKVLQLMGKIGFGETPVPPESGTPVAL